MKTIISGRGEGIRILLLLLVFFFFFFSTAPFQPDQVPEPMQQRDQDPDDQKAMDFIRETAADLRRKTESQE